MQAYKLWLQASPVWRSPKGRTGKTKSHVVVTVILVVPVTVG